MFQSVGSSRHFARNRNRGSLRAALALIRSGGFATMATLRDIFPSKAWNRSMLTDARAYLKHHDALQREIALEIVKRRRPSFRNVEESIKFPRIPQPSPRYKAESSQSFNIVHMNETSEFGKCPSGMHIFGEDAEALCFLANT